MINNTITNVSSETKEFIRNELWKANDLLNDEIRNFTYKFSDLSIFSQFYFFIKNKDFKFLFSKFSISLKKKKQLAVIGRELLICDLYIPVLFNHFREDNLNYLPKKILNIKRRMKFLSTQINSLDNELYDF